MHFITKGGTARCLLIAFLAVMGTGATPLPGSAQGVSVSLPDGAVIHPRSNGEVQQLVQLLIAQGDTRTAAALIRAWQPGNPDHAVRVAYVDGLIAAAQGDDTKAVTLWRGILAQRPGLDLVRVQLTRALARLGEDDGARFQARQLIAAGVDDRLGGAVSTLLRTLNARRPLSFGMAFALRPSTNVNGGTDNRTVRFGPLTGTISDDARRKSGIGTELSGWMTWRHALDPKTAITGSLDGVLTRYGSIGRTIAELDGSLGVERSTGRGRILLALTFGGRDVEGDPRYRYVGLSIEATTRIGQRWRLFTAPELRHEHHPASPAEDGLYTNIPVQLDYFHGADSFTRLIGGLSLARREEDRFSYREARLGIGHFREFPAGLTVYGQLMMARRDYEGDFPGMTEPRGDLRTSAQLTITKRDLVIAGFAPRVTLLAERTESNTAFDDTLRKEIGFRFAKDF